MPLAWLGRIAHFAPVSGCPGPLAELVDATDLKSVVRKDVPVRFRQGPPDSKSRQQDAKSGQLAFVRRPRPTEGTLPNPIFFANTERRRA
jgi:hypothetical protein